MDFDQDQEDLRQEIIYQLWKSYGKFKGNSQFSSWMYRVAINTAITYFKKDKKRIVTNELNDGIDIKAVEEDFEEESKLTHFYRAVKTLNRVEKALILLFIEGQSHKEISASLGLTEVNTRVKLNRTKSKLKTLIKNQGYEF
tara:strand:+ start:1500 stop:1925 length:426 start_codon:yes stop_codon:yes gene_type:complete